MRTRMYGGVRGGASDDPAYSMERAEGTSLLGKGLGG